MFDDLAPLYTAEEGPLVQRLAGLCGLNTEQRAAVTNHARDVVAAIRTNARALPFVDAVLQEFGLSTEEGVTLMRLSEALIRTPDFPTARRLIRDKLADGDWLDGDGERPFLVAGAAAGLQISRAWITASGGVAGRNLAAKLGDRVLHAAIERAMTVMGEHFVLGQTIEEALQRGAPGALHSFDMLGEGARTLADAEQYYDAYAHAVRSLAAQSAGGASAADGQGMSVKLSALHPRFEYAQRTVCAPVLVDRMRALALIAKDAGLGLTIDAEEADRLETTLLVFDALLSDPSLAEWDGLGIVVQAYQRRASAVIERIVARTRAAGRRIAVRLVKGAYWDMEIKRAQELGLESYPVFTRKENTDVSYLACAELLLNARDCAYPQFATHNAHTALAVHEMAGGAAGYEIQRLHGMGDALHAHLDEHLGVRSRVYAPVGDHRDLLPYLVRRLLENGANSSFVHQLLDDAIPVEEVVEDPVEEALSHKHAQHPGIPAPRDVLNGERLSAQGLDLTQANIAEAFDSPSATPPPLSAACIVNGRASGTEQAPIRNPADPSHLVGRVRLASASDVEAAIEAAARSHWATRTSPDERAHCLRAAADRLEAEMPELMALCVAEAGKTWPDAVAEVREAVDFCRYYADQAVSEPMAGRAPLGVVACIAPWNFPLAIFLGEVTASLAAGNTVIAKPAEQTPLIAARAVEILHAVGVPVDALHLILGDGRVGAQLVAHPAVKGVVFTGSTATAQRIALTLADTGRADTPLIAETGGINAMIIDSTALLEQAVQDVVASAFQSAGQRCSACRVVCVQEEVADDFSDMLSGAMDVLRLDDPARLSADVGPVIDLDAHGDISAYIADMRARFPVIGEAGTGGASLPGHVIQPIAFALGSLDDVTREVFGPVLHVVRFNGGDLDPVVEAINALGFGLTMGLHTRIDDRVDQVAAHAHVGNLYVNRNQIGAVVGVQPFGGEALSGTGPKAGGPHYMLRLSRPAANADLAAEDSGAGASLMPERKAGDVGRLAAPLKRAREAAKAWRGDGMPADVLANWITKCAREFGVDPAPLHDAAAAARAAIASPLTLPGPTGETNTLTLHPRGVLAALGDEAAPPSELLLAIARGLATGNAILLTHDGGVNPPTAIAGAWPGGGVEKDLIQLVDAEQAGALLTAAIDGVITTQALRPALADHVRRRDGPIIPVLSAEDDIFMFCVERTLTINTTAAGGNASLLAMGDDGADASPRGEGRATA